MDEIFKLLLSGTNPLAPKVQCECNLKCSSPSVAPIAEKNQTPNITFGNTHAETLSFGGAGFNIVRAAGFDFFLSIYCLALWCFHIFWSPNSVVETSLCMLLILFQTAQNIGFSQVYASCLSPVPFFLFPNSQLVPKCTKHRVFTGMCNLCASRPIFSIP